MAEAHGYAPNKRTRAYGCVYVMHVICPVQRGHFQHRSI